MSTITQVKSRKEQKIAARMRRINKLFFSGLSSDLIVFSAYSLVSSEDGVDSPGLKSIRKICFDMRNNFYYPNGSKWSIEKSKTLLDAAIRIRKIVDEYEASDALVVGSPISKAHV